MIHPVRQAVAKAGRTGSGTNNANGDGVRQACAPIKERGLQRTVDILRLTPYIHSVRRESGNGEESTRKSPS